MSLRESPYPSRALEGLQAVAWALIFPCFWFLDRLLAVGVSTGLERTWRREEECYLHPLRLIFGSALFLALLLVSAPFALLGFLLWAPLQAVRRPFSYRRQEPIVHMDDRNARWTETGRLSFGFLTGNLCLLPDGVARFNNLGHTQHRAHVIGKSVVQGVTRPHIRILVDSPSSCGTMTPSSSLIPQPLTSYGSVDMDRPQLPNCNQNSNAAGAGRSSPGDVPVEVSPLFPPTVDVLCLQEVFDQRAALKLTRALAPLYGHILYDVGVYACQPPGTCSSFKFFNSGLFLASRYPVMEAQYRCFPNGRGEDALAAKGLLAVKVEIGLRRGEKKMVGYVNCTHLHAPEGDGAIRCEQLNMLMKWISEFQAVSRRDDELVMFDVLCGDFNFDNCSPDDRLEQSHSVFEEYTDPCRAGAGKEKPWVIGTLLRQSTLYDENTRTPDNLQRTLESEDLRREYVCGPVPLAGVPLVYPEPDQPWIGRRIDYLLYRESDGHKTVPVTITTHTEVEELTYVTQLAGLTDHIPLGFRLSVPLDPEDT